MTWHSSTLTLLEREREVTIETTRPDGSTRRAIIWIVVDGEDAFVRSWKGERGRWYQDVLVRPEALLEVAGSRVPVRCEQASGADHVARVSRALERKYAGDPSTKGMVREEVLGTTLRLVPA